MHKRLEKMKNVVPMGPIVALILCGLLIGVCAAEKTDSSVFKFASPWVPKSIDTAIEGQTFIRLGIAEPLVGVDYNLDLVPMLAKSWSVSDDGLTWTFNLRDDVKFHDGTQLTADAAKTSLERTFKKATSYQILPIKEISARDEHTLIISTDKPFAPLPGYLAGSLAVIIAPSSLNEKDEVIEPIGTGPFKFDSFVPKESVTAVRFDDYWGNESKLDKVVHLGVPEEKTRVSMLMAGEIDMAWQLAPIRVLEMKANPDCKIYTTLVPRVNYLMLNSNKTSLGDLRIRTAISLALDRDLICNSLMDGVVMPAAGPFAGDLYWANKDIKPISYDLDKARSLLDEAGWVDGDNDGIREKDGKKLELSLYTYSTRAEFPPMAEAIKDQLGKAGIKVGISILDTAAITAQAKEGKVDMYLMSRGVLWDNDPDTWAADFLPGSSYQPYINYAPKDLESLILNGREIMDKEGRKKIYDQVQDIIMRDVPVVYINYYTNVVAVRPDVKGYREHPGELWYHLENVFKE